MHYYQEALLRIETLLALLLALAFTPRLTAASLPAPLSLNSGWQLQDAAKVAAPGPSVSRAGYQPRGWYKATVPGTVLTSLVADGVYPEPLYGENNRPDKIPDSLCRTAYWYRRTFAVPPSYRGKRVWLRFDGINYAADVWVNGHEAGTIKGAFARGLFDVTPYVVLGQASALAVQILPPPHPGVPLEQTVANGTGRNGGETARDGPTFLCTIGWDWIPGVRDRDMGLWQGVTLFATGPVVLRDPQVTSDLPLPRTDSADLSVSATVQNVTDKPQSGVLTGRAEGGIVFRQPLSLAASETKTVTLTPATTPALHVLRPHLWWPNGYGPQNLYDLHLAFATTTGSSDSQDVSFGIRKITYFVPGSDNLTLSVNGVPVFCKGGDWGMDEAMKRIGPKRLDAQVRMHQARQLHHDPQLGRTEHERKLLRPVRQVRHSGLGRVLPAQPLRTVPTLTMPVCTSPMSAKRCCASAAIPRLRSGVPAMRAIRRPPLTRVFKN